MFAATGVHFQAPVCAFTTQPCPRGEPGGSSYRRDYDLSPIGSFHQQRDIVANKLIRLTIVLALSWHLDTAAKGVVPCILGLKQNPTLRVGFRVLSKTVGTAYNDHSVGNELAFAKQFDLQLLPDIVPNKIEIHLLGAAPARESRHQAISMIHLSFFTMSTSFESSACNSSWLAVTLLCFLAIAS